MKTAVSHRSLVQDDRQTEWIVVTGFEASLKMSQECLARYAAVIGCLEYYRSPRGRTPARASMLKALEADWVAAMAAQSAHIVGLVVGLVEAELRAGGHA